ncbi:MAG: hypothetical protein M3229_00200, partial [Actinomycetota bacterium]|nr:hypothetical protein [Actinomycetota bacterium]
VGARAAADPRSYESVFARRLRATARAAPRFERLLSEWIPIDIETSPRSPWSVSAAEFWIASGANLLYRDGRVLDIPPALARRIRAARSLCDTP